MKYGNLNFLEPSWPCQACNRTALPFTEKVAYIMGVNVVTINRIDKAVSNFNKFNYCFLYISLVFGIENQYINMY